MLVFIVTSYSSNTGYVEPRTEAYYSYDTMEDCFKARETLSIKMGWRSRTLSNGYYRSMLPT